MTSTRTTHRKLAWLSLLMLGAGAVPAALAATGGLEPAVPAASAQAAFDQIVPGLTRAEDLPALGFDAARDPVDILSARDVETRLLAAAPRDATIAACVRARDFCTGMVFHRDGKASVTLLVMNGRVVRKVFSA